MSNESSRPAVTFVIPSERRDAALCRAPPAPSVAGLAGRVKAFVRVSASALRSSAVEVRITAVPGEDVVVLQIANGPTLVLHPETARDLMLAQQGANSTAAHALPDAESAPREVQVPSMLRWRGLDASSAVRGRDGFDDVPLSALEVVTDVVQDKAADFIAHEIADLVDAHVHEGIYPLARAGFRPPVPARTAAR